jgi:hypothetical protein
VWRGFLGPEGWPVDRDRGVGSIATLQGFDILAVAGFISLPSSPFAAYVDQAFPSWWIRGNSNLSANANGGTFFDESGHGIDAQVAAGAGKFASQDVSLVPSDNDPSMFLDPGVELIGVGVVTSNITSMCGGIVFKTEGNLGLNVKGPLITCINGTAFRWQFYLLNGYVYGDFYDNAGTLVGTSGGPLVNPDDPGGRWDDGKAHALFWSKPGGSSCNTKLDTQGASMACPSTLYSGDLVVGGGTEAVFVDEVWFTNYSSDPDAATSQAIWNGAALPFNAQTFAQRMVQLQNLAHASNIVTDPRPASGGATYWGADKIPATWLDGLRSNVADRDGAVYADREGFIRPRTFTALASGYASDYNTLCGHLTNEASPSGSPTPIPRSVLARSGMRLDRVINDVEVTLPMNRDPAALTPAGVVTVRAKDDASIARYGKRSAKIDTGLRDPADALAMAGSRLRYAQPVQEIKEVEIDPWGNDTVTTWVLDQVELEKAVKVTDVPTEVASGSPIGDPEVFSSNIQGIGWNWQAGTSWTVTLNLAKNGADAP